MSIISVFPGGGKPKLQSKTVDPSTSAKTVTSDSGYDGLSKVIVNSIPSSYVKPNTTKAATTYTPGTSDQSIAAGTYCSGKQIIKGDADLVAGNIKSGVKIFGVDGALELGYEFVEGQAVMELYNGNRSALINFDVISKYVGIAPLRLILIQNPESFEYGHGITFMSCGRGSSNNTLEIDACVYKSDVIDAKVYHEVPNSVTIELNSDSIRIVTDNDDNFDAEFNGQYWAILVYEKTS